ncbi:signal transduction histidine kinase [Sphingomonas sp. PvP055]|uniref:sensor histidine kinase n=1 Tax=Sphingomonas sp. PvP055 TaxID=3156391 RepID=UPI00339442A4
MSSKSSADPRARATWRWGGAIAFLLVAQSLVLAGLFWLLASGAHRRESERSFQQDCSAFAHLAGTLRRSELREALTRDIHRNRFLALFARDGSLIAGNVAALPAATVVGAASFVAAVRPTELPGKDSDVARIAVCAMPDGARLLTGVDLDDSQEALRVIEQSLVFGLLPGVLLAIGIGLFAGRRAAQQVDAVRALTERIVAGDLERRLPVGENPDSFGLLCANINTMLDRIEALVVEMRGVGDDIAHQLRTPLTRLRARIERGLRDPGNPSSKATADASLAEIDQLLGIVAALLRIRELEDHARRSRFAAVDLGRLAQDACDLHLPTAEDRGMTLTCVVEFKGVVEGDASLLMEALSNLIDNAMKFGPPGGRVTVTVRKDRGSIVIAVADEGDGVPVGERALVTQRFYRGRHDCEGAGLGLSLVKAIAELHGFALRFADTGSTASLVGPAPAV